MRAAPVALSGERRLPACRSRQLAETGDFGADFRIRGAKMLWTGLPATTGWQRVFFGTKTPCENMRPFGTGPIGRFLRLIRFSHTIFALPFALAALIVAANGWPSPRILLLVIVCMVFARTAAMLFNRLVDWSLDQRNPRTASRHLLVPKLSAVVLLILSCCRVSAGRVRN